MPTTISCTSSPSVDVDLDDARFASSVAALGGVGALAFVLSTVAGVLGYLDAGGYLLSSALAVGMVSAAVGIGHLKSSSERSRARRRRAAKTRHDDGTGRSSPRRLARPFLAGVSRQHEP